MSVEQLALLAIAVFSFMALANMFNSVRAIKHAMRFKPERIRRLIGGKESARAVAESIVKDIAQKFPAEANASMKARKITPELDKELEKARAYYLSRVEPIHKSLFNEALDSILLKKKSL